MAVHPQAQANKNEGRRICYLIILSGGGFTFETKCLIADFGADIKFAYLRTRFGGVPGENGLPYGPSVLVPSFATKTEKSIVSSVYAFFRTFKATLIMVRELRIDTIVGIGCSHTIPMFLAGRIVGCHNIFVESITRVQHLSTTGRIVYYLHLAEVFIVQWPSLKRSYPMSHLGTIL